MFRSNYSIYLFWLFQLRPLRGPSLMRKLRVNFATTASLKAKFAAAFTNASFSTSSPAYCFSHYVSAAFLMITRFKLLFPDWRGYLIAGFSLVWVANVYMGIFGRIRLDLRRERVEIQTEEASLPSKG